MGKEVDLWEKRDARPPPSVRAPGPPLVMVATHHAECVSGQGPREYRASPRRWPLAEFPAAWKQMMDLQIPDLLNAL